MTNDEWSQHVAREGAGAIGEWLEAHGHLERPIRSLTKVDLEHMAQAAIHRFIVLGSQRIAMGEADDDLMVLLLGRASARCADGRPEASPSSPACAGKPRRACASARDRA